MPNWYEYTGNIHMHTRSSDGSGTHAELAQAAQMAGLDFLIVTDHNILIRSAEGRYGSVLMLIGEEVHDPDRNPEGNHLLCLGIQKEVTRWRKDPQLLIQAVVGQGGLAFLAHPDERSTHFLPKRFPWHNWEVTGYTGIELWNYLSEFRGYASNLVRALLIAKAPFLLTTGPLPETLERWDQLTRQRPIVALGGSDAHAFSVRLGPWNFTILPYELCFRAVNTHILVPEPLTGEITHDRALILDALRQGHCWIGYDLLATTIGFRFLARQPSASAIMGDTLPAGERTSFEVYLPRPGLIRLLRDGQIIASAYDRELCFTSGQPGVYRVEVYRRAWGRRRGWIFSNPIYVM
jgi:hypothetical protein